MHFTVLLPARSFARGMGSVGAVHPGNPTPAVNNIIQSCCHHLTEAFRLKTQKMRCRLGFISNPTRAAYTAFQRLHRWILVAVSRSADMENGRRSKRKGGREREGTCFYKVGVCASDSLVTRLSGSSLLFLYNRTIG